MIERVFDTDHISLIERGNPVLQNRLSSVLPDTLAISVITVEEMLRVYQTNEITAPFITIPMMLNPKSELYEHLIHSPDIWLYVEEKGDLQSGFRPEKLLIDPEIHSSNGLIYIQMNHLTAIGLGSGSMPESETNKPEPRCIDCDRSSNCFLEVLFGW
jgi:hypothetical protein